MSTKHPRTAMLDLLEDLRLVIEHRPPGLSEAQVLAVLATLIEDVAGSAFTALSQRDDEDSN